MLDKYRGCLLGGAVGDALGFAVEFLEDFEIFKKYGENGITEYSLYNGVAQISDDTQMTLFTAEGLLSPKSDSFVTALHFAYLDWLTTQYDAWKDGESGLLAECELFSSRAPGNTCLSALGSGVCGTIEVPINRSKGCGGIMRVAPIALYYHGKRKSQKAVDLLAARAAAITHGHPLGYIPAAFLVHILEDVLSQKTIEEAVKNSIEIVPQIFKNSTNVPIVVALLERALELAETPELDDLEAVQMLGEGWVAEETLAIAVYCCLKHKNDFASALIASVNHSGDSDSTGAVTGNIIGASLGASVIPEKYTKDLELKELILNTAQRLYQAT